MSLFCSPGPDYDIKPGILPLVNDEDWELLEPSGMKAILKDGDQVMFISTLHGGWLLERGQMGISSVMSILKIGEWRLFDVIL